MRVRILHAADLHLDAAFEGLSPEKAAERRREQRELPGRIAAEARRVGADLVLLAGDILDTQHPYPETLEALAAAMRSLTIPVFIALGNHDYYSQRSPWARLSLPDNVRVFTSSTLERVALPSLGAAVWGAGYTSNACAPLLRGFHAPESDALDLLTLHAEVGRASSPYCPVTEEELAGSGFAYAALGHVHTYSGLRWAGGCAYAWPGCAAGRGFDECGEKGVILAEVSKEDTKLTFLPLHAREYREKTVLVDKDALRSIHAALPADAARHIYRITLTGQTPNAPALDALRAAMEDEVYDLTLLDETSRPEDIWTRMNEDTLRGGFLRRMRALFDEADERERATILEALRLGLAALDGREEPK